MGSAEHRKKLLGETTGKGKQVRILIPTSVSCQVMKQLTQKAHPEAEKTLKSHLRLNNHHGRTNVTEELW